MQTHHSLRIAIADNDPSMLQFYQEVLPSWGHEVLAAAVTGRQFLDACLRRRPEVALAEIALTQPDAIEVAASVQRQLPVAFILVAAAPLTNADQQRARRSCPGAIGQTAPARHPAGHPDACLVPASTLPVGL